MTKNELLKFAHSLPDDAEVLPIDVTLREDNFDTFHPWESVDASMGRYRREVDHLVTLRLSFRTAQEADFKRTYEDPNGSFSNLHSVPRK